MDKGNKTRTICMNCLHSVITNKHNQDPPTARLIISWSCDKCGEESDDIEFYDYSMRQINLHNNG